MRLPVRLSVAALSLLLLAPVTPILAKAQNAQAIVPVRATETPKSTGMTAEKAKTVLARVFDSVERRLDNYEAFLERVKTRRNKLSDEGKNVLKLDTFILTAETNLGNARTIAASAKVALSELQFTGNRAETVGKIKTETQKIRKALTTLHTSMSQTVVQLKAVNAAKSVKGGTE